MLSLSLRVCVSQAFGDESEEAEKQRALLEKEMDRNTAIARQLTSKERELLSSLPTQSDKSSST